MKTPDNKQAPASEQAPNDTPLKLSHNDLADLILALDAAIDSWKQNREEWANEDYEAGSDEYVDEEVAGIDAQIKTFAELKTRIQAEQKHCEHCRKVEKEGLCVYFPGQLYLCEAYYEVMEEAENK
jgi:hypothetical protein